MFRILLSFFISASIVSCQVVDIADGLIQGTTMQSRKGVDFHAFMQIPYAKPPIGELRFQPPVRNERWQGTLNATAVGPMCMQYTDFGFRNLSEDCLHLNVYTRDLAPPTLKPVIIFIHGGEFELGSGLDQQPHNLMDRDVVLVNVNYRLGAFGFLATGTADAVGNMGLKDQALAIQWVNRNIAKFGGDSNRVTLAGFSAGGFSATGHMVSDMSKGLFHRVIAVSGSITWQKGLVSDNLEMAREVAIKLNCSTEVSKMLECFMQTDAFTIALAARIEFYGCPSVPFIPVLEPDFGQERFFTRDPEELFKSGNFSRVPLVIGITKDEYLLPIAMMFENSTALEQLNENFVEFSSKCCLYDSTGVQSRAQIADALRKRYLPLEKIDKRSFEGFGSLCSDAIISYSAHRLVHYASSYTDVYYYKFSYVGRYSMFNYPRDKPYGAHHGDDVQYTFPTFYIGPLITEDDPENFMVERMTRIWEQFARTGNPNNATDAFLSDMNWPKHDAENEYYLDIGQHLVEKQGLNLERYTLWDSFENEPSAASAVTQLTFLALLFALVSHLLL